MSVLVHVPMRQNLGNCNTKRRHKHQDRELSSATLLDMRIVVDLKPHRSALADSRANFSARTSWRMRASAYLASVHVGGGVQPAYLDDFGAQRNKRAHLSVYSVPKGTLTSCQKRRYILMLFIGAECDGRWSAARCNGSFAAGAFIWGCPTAIVWGS